MSDISVVTLANIWSVLVGIGGYQLYLQLSSSGRKLYPEGFIKILQYLAGIPAFGSLGLFLFDPDSLRFVFTQLPGSFHEIGLVLFNVAAAAILWSHLTLKRSWSGDLETLPEHHLVDSGPYAFVRHPLYASYLLLTVGFFFATANWFVGGFMFIYFLTVAARAQIEEEMLVERLGAAYTDYRVRTSKFFPSPLKVGSRLLK